MSNSAKFVGLEQFQSKFLPDTAKDRSQYGSQKALFADFGVSKDGIIDPPGYVECEEKQQFGSPKGWRLVKGGKPPSWWKTERETKVSSRHWKPRTLRAPILGGLIVFSLSMIGALEVLSHISSGNGNMNGGGVAFAADTDGPSILSTFSFLYFPTILAVIYSMIWSWVDLDAKRIEPWFQLSKKYGATADDSLLIQYPFDFLPFIPLAAFHRRHWGVFFAGSIMLMVFWIVTPLQSAIFNTGTVIRSIHSTMMTTGSLTPLEKQSSNLNANFMNTAYGISWLNQALPPFTTAEFALLPFEPLEGISATLSNSETWSTIVDAYSTSLKCTPANVSLSGLGYTFDNAKGCSVSQINLPDTQDIANYMVTYIGYYDNPQVDWSLANPNCSVEFSNTFLAVWASAASHAGNGIYNNMTAQFCETSYHTRKMYVQVNASSTEEIYTEIPSTLSATDAPLESIFNVTNFEYLLATGVTPTSERANLQDDSVVEQFPRIRDYSIAWPVSNMVGFAIALNTLTVEDLVAPSALQSAFQSVHQLLLSTAFSTLVQVGAETQELRDGYRLETVGAIVMVRSISIIVEIGLAVISLFTVCLWYVSHSHQSNLEADPASIADVMSIISPDTASKSHLDMFKDDGTLTADRLADVLSSNMFYLDKNADATRPVLLASELASAEFPQRQISADSRPSTSSKKLFTPVRPLELRFAVGAALIGVLIFSLATLTFLEIITLKNDGINLPSSNPVVLSILENYLPTAFSTFLEPVWVILNRLLCLLKPLDELRKGNAKPSASLEAKYTSLPPQLAFWRALKSHHFLLAAVCVVAFSSNILAVALSGLLMESPTPHLIPFDTSQSLLPQFNGTSIFNQTSVVAPIQYLDHFYVALSNLSDGTILPSWIDENFFYLPFELQMPPETSNAGIPLQFQGFRGSTTGFGAESTCVELSSTQQNNSVLFQPALNDTSAQFTTSYTFPNGSIVTCFPHTANSVLNETTQFTSSPDGTSALEVMRMMTPANDFDNSDFCSSILVAGWVRSAPQYPDTNVNSGGELLSDLSLTSTFLSCIPKLRIAPFDILVDSEGHILSANQTGPFINDTSPYFAGNASENSLFQQSNNLIAPLTIDGFTWHNDSFTSDWMNVLLELIPNSPFGKTGLVDPAQPVPRAEVVAPMVQNMYQTLFAILLGLNTHVFSPAETPTPMIGEIEVVESKIFVQCSMFVLSVAILAFHLIVAVLYYTYRPRRFLPRMPTSIGSIIAFVSASRALEDFAPGRRKDRDDERYGYGRFIGTDGKTHVGIEKQRYVVPLKSQNPDVKRRRRWPWRREQRDEKEVKTWI